MSKYAFTMTVLLALTVTAPSFGQFDRFEGRNKNDSALGKLEKAWRDAEEEGDRRKISKKASELLESQFDKDMERRIEELAKVEERIDRLRAQLSKREDKRDDIISLQLKQVTMAWDGLGWTEPQNNRIHQHLYMPASAPQPPASPFLRPNDNRFMFKPQNLGVVKMLTGGRDSVKKIVEAAVRGDDDVLAELAEKLAKKAKGADPVQANDMIWSVFEEVGDQVEDKQFWVILGEAAEGAADGVDADDDPRTAGNILDTAAHCYFLGGEEGTAAKLQNIAVKFSAAANDGEPDGAILEFLAEIDKEGVVIWTKSRDANDESEDEDDDDDEGER